jgi:hypothetical protein
MYKIKKNIQRAFFTYLAGSSPSKLPQHHNRSEHFSHDDARNFFNKYTTAFLYSKEWE